MSAGIVAEDGTGAGARTGGSKRKISWKDEESSASNVENSSGAPPKLKKGKYIP